MNMSVQDDLDPVTVEVIRNKLEGIADEMGIKLIRSSFSPMVKEGFDAAASLFTIEGEVLSQAMSVPGHLSALVPIVRQFLKTFPLDRMSPGDAFILNDPYMGGTHIPDIGMMVPIFHDGRVIALSATISHHQDLGGMVPGSLPTTATELFQEGFRIPPLRYRTAAGEDQTFLALLRKNVRFPDMLLGDLNAQYASCVVGIRRIQEMADLYGGTFLQHCFASILDRSEQMTREALRRVPDGTYRYEETIDNDGVNLDQPVKVAVAVTVRDGLIDVDFTGTNPQVAGPINCVPAAATAPVYFAVRAASGAHIPTNGGCFRGVTIHFPEGSLVNPLEPAPVNSRTAALKRIAVCMLGALRQALPDDIPADAASQLLVLIFGGTRDGGQRYITGELIVGGGGAGSGLDGIDVIDTDNTNCMNNPVETLEFDAPLLVRRFELAPNTGGIGQYRGGLGVRREYLVLEGSASFTHRGERHFFPAKGFRGGGDGQPARSEILRKDGSKVDIPSKMVTTVAAGDRIIVQTAGGGGYGDPALRAQDALAADLADGKISAEALTRDWRRPADAPSEPADA
ncbi:hydantoinase B/oxoprolinase family protein [Roseovarius atlanticus]|uniref:hydantoinase B/oxoprolinase family protein n=2 Tax=Roseovarius atlanticus TaxID=1641875 RepID=UPI001C99DE7A|nr:hydantoinase B/oxoprolinase family protein [Roseovarius atlanticus]MBY5989153.1 hydantoinase B/oxoprolinase family protein [Roseovarius atlanticus]